jgi:transcription elongation factor Elf1
MEDDIQTKIILFLNDKATQYACEWCRKRAMKVTRIYYDRIYWTRVELTCKECGKSTEVKIAFPKEITDEYPKRLRVLFLLPIERMDIG